jgi:alkylation response protein AidB-like acyl-CoA dehydrogenase
MGATGLLAPEHHGGAGLGMLDVGVVAEELGRAVTPGPFISSAVGALSALALAGSEDDRARWMPGLVAGTAVGALALVEPGQRTGREAPRAVARQESAGWALAGVKSPVADGVQATLLLTSAVDERGVAGLFAVDAVHDCTRREIETVDPTRQWAQVELDESPAVRLGAADAHHEAAIDETLDRVVTALVVDGVGAADAALAMALEYAKSREQFGQPIGAFQAVQHLCAGMLQSVEMARAGAYYALWACDAAPAAERRRAVTMAKAFAGDALYKVGADAIQVFGGIGFTWEHDAHLYYKRLLTLQEAYGGTAEHLEALAALVI